MLTKRYLFLSILVFMLSGCGYESKDIRNIDPNIKGNGYSYICINDITYLTYSAIYQFGLTTLLDIDGKPVICEGKE